MIRDIRIAVSFLGHRKRRRLSRELGHDCTGYLLNLWIRTAITRPDGVLRGMDAVDIACDAEWEGDPARFVDALILCGWIDVGEDKVLRLHDWAEHQAWVIGAASRSLQSQKAALVRHHGREQVAHADAAQPGEPTHVSQKMPEVGQESGKSVLAACGQHADSMQAAVLNPQNSSAPLLSSSSTLKEPKNPPVPSSEGTSPRGGEPPYTKAFLAWWEEYPIKVKKPRAWKAWRKIKGVDAPTLIRAVRAQLAAGHFMVGAENCIPHPSTWLNDERWKDEIKASGSSAMSWASQGEETGGTRT